MFTSIQMWQMKKVKWGTDWHKDWDYVTNVTTSWASLVRPSRTCLYTFVLHETVSIRLNLWKHFQEIHWQRVNSAFLNRKLLQCSEGRPPTPSAYGSVTLTTLAPTGESTVWGKKTLVYFSEVHFYFTGTLSTSMSLLLLHNNID